MTHKKHALLRPLCGVHRCRLAQVLARERTAFEEGVVARFESYGGRDVTTCRIAADEEPLPDICAKGCGILGNL